jgi:predicted DNA-binding transcriptional regulator YafY
VIETSARLLRLLALLQAQRFWSGSALARELEITERTLRRDIDRLRSLGYPVHSTAGVAGGYELGAGRALPPLSLEDDEALAVAIGLSTAAGGGVAGVEEAALRALTKLEQVLPERIRRRINAIHSHVVAFDRSATKIDAGLLATIAGACRERKVIHFDYEGGERATEPRRVEPYGLVHTGHRWYLVGWDLERADWRTFRIDRVRRPLTPRSNFTPRQPPDADLAAYVSRAVSTAAYQVQARVIFYAPLEAVREHISPSAGFLESIDSQRCRLTTGANSLDSLAFWISIVGVDFEVEDPPALRERIAALAARLTRSARLTAVAPR